MLKCYSFKYKKNWLGYSEGSIKKDKNGLEEIYSFSNLERNYMFEKMHLDIFNQQKNVCTFKEALEVMDTISTIQEQNR